MAAINWLAFTERLVGIDHPSLTDTVNRALRQILEESGYDPDADPFPGLMGPVFNVHAYGAVGDGTTDDGVALLATIASAEAVNGTVVLAAGKTYLSQSALTLHRAQILCPGAATLKFSGLGASTDCITIQGSTSQFQAGIEGVTVDCNSTGRDGVVFAGGKTGAGSSDFAFLKRFKITGAVRDGVHMEPAAANFWIENLRLSDGRVETCGRHGIALICPDLSTVFINKCVYDNVEVRGSGQSETGYEVYVEGNGTVAGQKIAEHVWVNPEFDAQGGADHGAHAVYFTMPGSVLDADAWAFITATFEDTGSVAGLGNAIGIDTGAVVRGLCVLPGAMADYTGIVDESLLTGNAIVISSNLNVPLIRISDSSGNTMVVKDDTIQWRASGGVLDTNLYREAVDRLFSDDLLGAAKGFRQTRTVVTSTSGAITLVDGTSQVNLSENVTEITMPAVVDGKEIEVQFRQPAAANHTVAGWPAAVRLAGGAYTATATNAKVDVLKFRYNAGLTAWLETSRNLNV